MQLKMFTSILHVTLPRVVRAAHRPRSDFEIALGKSDRGVHTLTVSVEETSRTYPIGNNSQWSRALLNDALDGVFQASLEQLRSSGRVAALAISAESRVKFLGEFSAVLKMLEAESRDLNIVQAGALCLALQRARALDMPGAFNQLGRVTSAPEIMGAGAQDAGVGVDFVRNRLKSLTRELLN